MTLAGAAPEAKPVRGGDPDELKGDLKSIGGSRSDQWNNLLANSAIKTLWTAHSDDERRDQQYVRRWPLS